MRTILKSLMVALCAGTLVAVPAPAIAAPPSNDTEAGAVPIDSVPFTHSMDASEATADGPRFCSTHATVFYTFTPSENVRVQVDTLGSEYDTALAVFTRDRAGDTQRVGCNNDRIGWASGLRLRAIAGTTYVLMVARCCGDPQDGRPGRSGGPLVLTLTEVTDVPLEVTIAVAGGTVDSTTGIATISATITCTNRSVVYAAGILRQVRQELFVARGWWGVYMPCTPDAPVAWSYEVDTETSVAFGTGAATFRRDYIEAYAGWRDWFTTYEAEVTPLQLA